MWLFPHAILKQINCVIFGYILILDTIALCYHLNPHILMILGYQIPSGNLTQLLKIQPLQLIYLFKMVIFYSYVSLPEDSSPNPNHHSNDVAVKSSKMNKNDTFPRSRRRYDGPMLEAMPARQPPITIIYPDSSIHKHIVNIINIIKYPYIYISIYSFIIYP